MKQRFSVVAAFAAVVLGACGDAPTEVTEGTPVTAAGELVITRGVQAPEFVPINRRADSDLGASASLGGSSSSPLALFSNECSEGTSQQVVVTFTITGRQANPASFKVNTSWNYSGSAWLSSVPATVSVPARAAGDAATIRTVTLTVTNGSIASSGTSSFTVVPFDLVTTPQATLNVEAGNVAVYTAFDGCEAANTAPTLIVPADFTVEAASSAGAVVTFVVTATDLEDGDLSSAVVCTPASGTTFPLGTTEVECSVQDAGGLTTTRTFNVTVDDTTPAYFTAIPTTTQTLIAADINGAVLDITAFGITVADVGGVSEPSTFACLPTSGAALTLGSTTTVSCTATDADGNTSAPSSFNVFVGLNVAGSGFLPPLRNDSPFSAHKRGSTIPHKFLPPTYADGTPATDLAGGLRLVLTSIGGDLPGTEIEANDYTAGSTEWRYDPVDGHYIFNLKSQTAWQLGAWQTTVSFAGIPLAQTEFVLKK